LARRFDAGRLVLDGVTVGFDEGSMTAITGPSGSGKTILLYCLSGMLRPTAGRVLYRGVDIATQPQRTLDELRRTSFGFVFQAYNLIEALTAVQNVRLPSMFGARAVSRTDAIDALAQVGLSGFEDRYPAELSGGQCQRVAIARALAVRRNVLFADEPTGALDSTARREVLQHLTALPALGTSVVMVTHDPTAAAAASRVLFLYDGRIVDSLQNADAREIARRLADLEAA
jgi:putative ABC transport system ATP-binding protein